MKKVTALYRHFNAAGALLYVGIAVDQLRRLKQHEFSAEWHREIDHIRVQWFDSRDEALAAERTAAECEKPLFNIRLQERDRKGRFFIYHPFSGRADGTYFRLHGAREMLKEWCESFPSERFALIEAPTDRPYWGGDYLNGFNAGWCEFPSAENWLTSRE